MYPDIGGSLHKGTIPSRKDLGPCPPRSSWSKVPKYDARLYITAWGKDEIVTRGGSSQVQGAHAKEQKFSSHSDPSNAIKVRGK